MMTAIRYINIIFLTVLLFGKTYAQDTTTTSFFEQIRNHDLSTILMADSIDNSIEKFKKLEIIGFIGDDYQRLFIHFVSMIQNPTNPYEYLVYGKTKVKETICSFQGTITIRNARMYKNAEFPDYQQGYTTCDVMLYEDKKERSTGFFKGTLTTNFIIDMKGKFSYDALLFYADGFANNQFVGSWTSYKTSAIKKCHWGDYRIPKCGDLDNGAGAFIVSTKYLKNGWENYKKAYSYNPNESETQKARQKENEQWWK